MQQSFDYAKILNLGIIFTKKAKEMRKNIHNFTMSGIIGSDSHLIPAKEHYERLLTQQMRDSGYVPVLDMLPQVTTTYIEHKDQYSFSITMFGVFVGKKKALSLEGFSGQEFLPR